MAFQTANEVYMIKFYFQSEDQGWSEVLYTSELTGAQAKALGNTLLPYRRLILPQKSAILYAKVSHTKNPRDAQILDGNFPLEGQWGNKDDTVGTGADDAEVNSPNDCLRVRYEDGNGSWSYRFLHGVPDPAVKGYVLQTSVSPATTASATVATSVVSADTVWSSRVGAYLNMIRQNTLMYRKAVAGNNIVEQTTAPIQVSVTKVTTHKVGRPFGTQVGRAPIR